MKKITAFLLSIIVMLPSANLMAAEAKTKTIFPNVGESFLGYTVTEKTYANRIESDITVLNHDISGATVLCIQNNDPVLSFTIGYRTPGTDETDRNHVFEHSIVSSSSKYKSTDIFFDLSDKGFCRDVNAATLGNSTLYYLTSTSQAQLEKGADIYLSCMVDSDFLRDENFFKREAINYTLDDKESDIEMGGVVFSEDISNLTDVNRFLENSVADTLYPGEICANYVGQAMYNYKDLTYEHTKELYDMCYNFDNSIIVLYGNMDYASMLNFIDENYLSLNPNKHTDLSKYAPMPSREGYTDKKVYYPAYEETDTENKTFIAYAFDIYDLSEEDTIKAELITNMLNEKNSPINKKLSENGINSYFIAANTAGTDKTSTIFILNSTNEDLKDKFKDIIDESLDEIISDGLGDIYTKKFEKDEFSNALSGSYTVDPSELSISCIFQWSKWKDANWITKFCNCYDELKNDTEQSELKRILSLIKDSKNKALLTISPKPGMAEEIENEIAKYLSDMKSNMSDEEIEEMIKETETYYEWQNDDIINDDVSISPDELPYFDPAPKVDVIKENGITSYTSEIKNDIGYFTVFFDASNITQDELYYLNLFDELFYSYKGREKYTDDELSALENTILYENSTNIDYDSDSDIPLKYEIMWYGCGNDYEDGLKLYLDLLQSSDFSSIDDLKEELEVQAFNYDPQNINSYMDASIDKANIIFNQNTAFYDDLYGKGYYDFLNEQIEKLEENPSYANVILNKVRSVRDKIVRRNNIETSIIGNKNTISKARATNNKVLAKLPPISGNIEKYEYEMPLNKTAYIVPTPLQYTTQLALTADLKGEYIPFINYIQSEYTNREVRFKNGAYTAYTSVILAGDKYAFIENFAGDDPNLGKTIDTFDNIADFLENSDISQEKLNNFIISSYSDFGTSTNEYSNAITAISYKMNGVDQQKLREKVYAIRNAKISNKQDAVDCIREAFKNAALVTYGNEYAINADSEYFDEIIDTRISG